MFLPATPAGYLVLGSLRPRSGTTLAGARFPSLLGMPETGWDVRTAPGTQNYGLITLECVSHVRITGLRLRGALKTPSLPDGRPDFRFTPQLVQIPSTKEADVEDVVIDHCRFESNRVNAIWQEVRPRARASLRPPTTCSRTSAGNPRSRCRPAWPYGRPSPEGSSPATCSGASRARSRRAARVW